MAVFGLILAVAFVGLVPAAVSALSIRHNRGWIAGLMAAGFLAGLLINNAATVNNPSFEAIGHEVMSAFVFAPALVGTLLGATFGWWKWRRS